MEFINSPKNIVNQWSFIAKISIFKKLRSSWQNDFTKSIAEKNKNAKIFRESLTVFRQFKTALAENLMEIRKSLCDNAKKIIN